MRQKKYFIFSIICLFSLLMFSGITWAKTHRSIHLSWIDQNVSDTTMVVTWLENISTQAYVEYGAKSMTYTKKVLSTNYSSTNLSQITPTYVHTAELYNLLPNTTYFYRVGFDGNMSKEKSFTTGPPIKSNEKFRFIVGSDCHANTTGTKRSRLAYHILRENPKPGFLFFGGDEITGNNGHVHPPNVIKWSKQWNDFFSPDAAKVPFKGAWAKMLEQFPYMTSDSNHVDSDDSFFNLFQYPYPFGTGRLADKIGAESNCSYAISFPPDKRGNNGWYSFNYGNAHFIVLQINTAQWSSDPRFCTWDVPLGYDQYIWLEDDLKEADSDPGIRWKFAIWHSAPYSFVPPSPKQSIDAETYADRSLVRNQKIQKTVSVLFNKYNVDMAFSGHQHRYERSKMIINDDSTIPLNNVGEGKYIDSPGGDYSVYDRTKDGEKKGVIYIVTGGAGNVTTDITLSDSDYTATKKDAVDPTKNVPIHFKANHYLTVDIDNTTGTATCKVMGYMVDGTTILFENAPNVLDEFRIIKRPDQLKVINGETTMGEGIIKNVIDLDPPIVPSHAFVMVSASNSNHTHNATDNCGVFQVTGSFSPNGKKLILLRKGNEGIATTPKAHISYQIIQSPDIKVLHGSEKINKFDFSKNPYIEWTDPNHSIPIISSRSNVDRAHYHESQIMANVINYEDAPNAELSLTRNSADYADVDVEWSVVKFKENVKVQKGFLELKSGKTQEVKLLTTIDLSKSWLYFTTSGVIATIPGANTNGSIEDHMVKGTITNSNTILFSRAGGSTVKYPTIQWFVVEFPSESNAYVQRGTLLPGKLDKKIGDFISAQQNSFIFHSVQGAGILYDFARTAWINRFTSFGTGIEFERWVDGQPGGINWQVVKFPE